MQNNMCYFNKPYGRTQTGAALAISLIMLLLLTIIGVTAMQSTTVQERMAGNARERNNAFQVAESGLSLGERYIDDTASLNFVGINSDSANGLYLENTDATNAWYLGKLGSDATSARGDIHDSDYSYVIEELSVKASESLEAGLASAPTFYRITTSGTGPATGGIVMLQSIYKR